MDSVLGVHYGWKAAWYDYTGQGGIWTVTDQAYTWFNIFLGIVFGSIWPCVERIALHLLAWLVYLVTLCSHPREATDAVGQPLFATAAGGQGGGTGGKGRKCTLANVQWFSFKAMSKVILVVGIAWQSAGAFVTTFPTDEAALSSATNCGLWGLKDTNRPEAIDKDGQIQGEKEIRAGQYARDCYGPQSAASLDQCMLFKDSYIASNIYRNEPCPFKNDTYCQGDGYNAVKFTTNLADVRRIGVNVKNPPTLNRTTVCVPLNLKAGFVRDIKSPTKQWGLWAYDLGPVGSEQYSSPHTFVQYADPWFSDVRSYSMSTYTHVYSEPPQDNYWQPIPALKIRDGLRGKSEPYSITIMFINSCRFFYREPSTDPIFPAEAKYRDTDKYWNYDSRARPLACIDWIEVCPHGNASCTPPYDSSLDVSKGNDVNKAIVLTRSALLKSNTFHSIQFRGAAGLDAQSKIQDDISGPLSKDPPQWIVESWGLFNTSLARVQYDALDIANGTGRDNPLYGPQMSELVRNKMCRLVLFQMPKGYNNITIWYAVLILVASLLVWLIGLETSKEFWARPKQSWYLKDNKLIGIEWLISRCLSGEEAPATDQNDGTPATPAQTNSPHPSPSTTSPSLAVSSQAPDSPKANITGAGDKSNNDAASKFHGLPKMSTHSCHQREVPTTERSPHPASRLHLSLQRQTLNRRRPVESSQCFTKLIVLDTPCSNLNHDLNFDQTSDSHLSPALLMRCFAAALTGFGQT